MRRRRWIWIAALVAVAGSPGEARPAGYGIYEAGAAVLGMAGAGTASVRDASALFYNPAALTRILAADDRLGLWYVGGSILNPFTSFAGVNPYPGYGVTEEMEANLYFIPATYYARRLDERWVAGLGINTDYGLGVEWKDPDNYSGRYIVTEARLDSWNLGLSAAYEITPAVSVAAGADLLMAKVRLQNRILQPAPGGGGGQVDVGRALLESDWEPGYGWNAAISAAPAERWRLGAAYRGKVVSKPTGDAEFGQILTGNAAFDAAVAQSLPPDQGVSTVLRFPAIWSAGVAWMPERWTFETSLVFTEWSLFRDLPLEFEQTPQNNRTIEEHYDDALAVRVGAEHRRDKLTYRAGYYFEQEAAPSESMSPLLPDAPRHGFTLGLGLQLGSGVTVDVYNLALFPERRDTEGVNRDGLDGEYKSYVNAAGLNLGFRW
jgi:long-chain fatty acid transport protein